MQELIAKFESYKQKDWFRIVDIAKDFFRATAIASLGIVSLLLTACGGGGGGSGSSASATPTTPAVAHNAGDVGAGGTGEVTIAWTSSSVSIDGSCSPGIQGYRINVGLSPGFYEYSTTVYNARLSCMTVGADACGDVQRCTYTVQGLTAASWYIAVQSIDVYGNESGYSDPIVATIVN